jgi:hypothetical protein
MSLMDDSEEQELEPPEPGSIVAPEGVIKPLPVLIASIASAVVAPCCTAACYIGLLLPVALGIISWIKLQEYIAVDRTYQVTTDGKSWMKAALIINIVGFALCVLTAIAIRTLTALYHRS